MRTSSQLLKYVHFGLACAAFLSAASAEAQRAFVSAKSGSDANPCTLASPCRSFGTAIGAVGAGGEIVVLDSGGYGPVTITKSITIESPEGIYAGIASPSGVAITINAGSSDKIILRGLVLSGGSDYGIRVNTAGTVHVEHCVIANFSSSGLGFFSGGNLFVSDPIVRENGVAGIRIQPFFGTAKALIDHCRLENNFSGLDVESGVATVRDSVAGGSLSGFGNLGELNIENCVVTNNDFGIFGDGGLVRVSDTTVTANTIGIALNGGSVLSRGNNTVEGNTNNGSFSGPYLAK